MKRTFDYQLVKRIITDPKIYKHHGDDYARTPEEFAPVESDRIIYLVARDGDELLGMFVGFPQTNTCYEVHNCILPPGWGERGIQAAKLALEWVFENTKATRIFGTVPECNRLALRFAKKTGLVKFGFNPDSFLKHGKLYGQTLLGISKENLNGN